MEKVVPSGGVQARNDPGRHESEEEREDRNLIELLQELRVASIGIQVLFGFLLSLPFTARFGKLDVAQRRLYIASLLIAALATALLSAPVAYHRIVFRQHKKGRLLKVANAMALGGMASVGIAVSSSVLLVSGVVFRGIVVPLISVLVTGMFVVLWLVIPVLSGRFEDSDES
jgi:hypothetical protein